MLHTSWFPHVPPCFNVVLCPRVSRARMGVYFYRPDVLFQWCWHQHWNWGSKGDHHRRTWRWAFISATPVAHNSSIYPTKCIVRHCTALHDTVRHCVALYDCTALSAISTWYARPPCTDGVIIRWIANGGAPPCIHVQFLQGGILNSSFASCHIVGVQQQQ